MNVAYAQADSPLGSLLLAASPRGLVQVTYLSAGAPPAPSATGHHRTQLDEARRQLDEYFAGRRQRFDLRVDWSQLAGFRREVLRTTARIPYGVVRTYGEVAADAGSPRGARPAGNALGSNPVAIVVPCHRVVAAGHRIGGYSSGLDKKEFLLALEGVHLA